MVFLEIQIDIEIEIGQVRLLSTNDRVIRALLSTDFNLSRRLGTSVVSDRGLFSMFVVGWHRQLVLTFIHTYPRIRGLHVDAGAWPYKWQ